MASTRAPGADQEEEPSPAGRVERLHGSRPGPLRRLGRWLWPPTPFGMFVVAFVLLLGSAGAIAWGQFLASSKAPWVSIGLSAAAVVATVLALFLRPRRRPVR
jgi:hypothetical protein